MGIKEKLLNLLLSRKKKNFDNNSISNILFIRPAKIGDAIVSFPLLREIKRNNPTVNIDVLAGVYNHDIYRRLSYVNNVYLKHKKRDFYKTWKTIYILKKNNYDLIIDTTDIKFWFTFSTRLIGANYYFSHNSSNKYLGYKKSDLEFYDKVLDHKDGLHTTYRMTNYLKLMNIYKYSTKLEFPLTNSEVSLATEFKKTLSTDDFIALNIEASSESRSISISELSIILTILLDYLENLSVVVLCLPENRSKVQELIHKFDDKKIKLSYKTNNIFEAASLIKESKLVISPDTSFVHIASAYNISQICFYRDDDNHILDWGPLSDKSIIIKSSNQTSNSIKGFDPLEIITGLKRLNIK
jgi:ADP-heptose:LPS heptosyltransferase